MVVSTGLGPSFLSQLAQKPTWTIERSSVPRQCTWEGDWRGEEILLLVENLQVGLKWSAIHSSRQRQNNYHPLRFGIDWIVVYVLEDVR